MRLGRGQDWSYSQQILHPIRRPCFFVYLDSSVVAKVKEWRPSRNPWHILMCLLKRHKPKFVGGSYETDYGREWDGYYECERCGEGLPSDD